MVQQALLPLQEDVLIRSGIVTIEGRLDVPNEAQGIVIFAHGSGSSRHSQRNRYVAQQLQKAGLGTLLMDLLTEEESEFRNYVFDIGLLADRIGLAAHWLQQKQETAKLPIGLFGASTGAGAALVAAAQYPYLVKAVVSRGGRPDLAGDFLEYVKAPTLLIVGGFDEVVIGLNEEAQRSLEHCQNELVIVPGATHLFEESGKLELVAKHAKDWFCKYLVNKNGH